VGELLKKHLGILAIFGLLLSGVSPANAATDEEWLYVTKVDPGYHSLLIQEKTEFFRSFPRLENWITGRPKSTQCDSINQSECRTTANFNAHYPVCGEAITRDCISKFSIINSSNTETMAEFQFYMYADHVGDFVGDGRRVMRDVESPSIWKVPEVPHAHGDTYLVVAGQDGGYGRGWSSSANYAAIYAVELVQTDCVDCLPACTTAEGCGGAAPEWFDGHNCIITTEKGLCAAHRPMPMDIRPSLEIRSGIKPTGWFHGRMTQPDIQVGEFGNQQLLTITASPVRVPILTFPSTQYSQLPTRLKNYWDDCLKKRTCPTGTRMPNSAEDKTIWPFGDRRQVETSFTPDTPGAIEAIRVFAPFIQDKSVAVPTYWSYRTLSTNVNQNPCFARTKGIQGIVTTNAIAYEDGAPKYQRGFLNYRVAGLHFLPNGEKALGTYDLVMRSDLARCLYGFSRAAVSASITISGDGEKDIATTIVGEKNGWLKLAAYGFTFSSKTIQVRLTQQRSTTINCVSASQPTQTRKVTGVSPKCPPGFRKR
jgi:hypothetical protein